LPDAAARRRAEIATFIDATLKHDVGVESSGPNLALALELFRKLERGASDGAAALIAELRAGWLSEAADLAPTPSRAGGDG
jgi:hypothetical protein